MEHSQELDNHEGSYVRSDGDGSNPTGRSGLAKQNFASSTQSSSIGAPVPQKHTLADPEALLLENQGSAGLESPAHVVLPGGESHEPVTFPRPGSIGYTPPNPNSTAQSTGTTPEHDRRRRRVRGCDSCRKRKIRCNGENPCRPCQHYKIACVYGLSNHGTSRTDALAISALEAIEQRGRNRNRDDSPPPFQSSDRAMSHSPDSQFYHSEVEGEFDTRPVLADLIDTPNTYRYTPLDSGEIRLLRISPANVAEPMQCTLKILSIETITSSALEFQALSYAWVHDNLFETLFLTDAGSPDLNHVSEVPMLENDDQQVWRTFQVHKDLYNALKRIRDVEGYVWLWVDAICIDQSNEQEKSQQIPKMPDIYSSAWNVIVWLGETGRQHIGAAAANLIPKLLNLKVLDMMLQSEGADHAALLEDSILFMDILHLPWFTRRWVIQEIACARRLSLRIGSHVISWVDFADAVELFLDKLDRMRELYSRSQRARYNPDALQGVERSGAKALMELSRNVFRKNRDSQKLTRLMDLESLVLSTTSFAVTEVRDVIYALLYLANDITGPAAQDDSNDPTKQVYSMTADYSRHAVDIFSDFVLYCIVKSRSLDVICRRWAIWPRPNPDLPFQGRVPPSWVGVAAYSQEELWESTPGIPLFGLVGAPHKSSYTASRGFEANGKRELDILEVNGLIIGNVGVVSAHSTGATITGNSLRMLGWTGTLSDGVPDRLWRTLVVNRTTDGRILPGWYRRACALALTKLTPSGDLNIPGLLAGPSQPSTMIEYLRRVQEVAHSRRVFQSAPHRPKSGHADGESTIEPQNSEVGIGPEKMMPGDMVCVLFGCSVPVILRPIDDNKTSKMQNVKLLGEAYLHDHMEGEALAELAREEVERRSTTFRIH